MQTLLTHLNSILSPRPDGSGAFLIIFFHYINSNYNYYYCGNYKSLLMRTEIYIIE